MPLVMLSEVSEGGGSTVKVTPVAVVIPPDITLMVCAPSVAVPLILNVAVSSPLFTKVVPVTEIPMPVGGTMVALETKFAPITVTGTVPPCAPVEGVIEATVGGPVVTWKLTVLLVMPWLSVTETVSIAVGAPEESVSVAVISELLTTCTSEKVPPVPPKFKVTGAVKPEPMRVTVKEVPEVPLLGMIEVSVGMGVEVRLKTVMPPTPSYCDTMK